MVFPILFDHQTGYWKQGLTPAEADDVTLLGLKLGAGFVHLQHGEWFQGSPIGIQLRGKWYVEPVSG